MLYPCTSDYACSEVEPGKLLCNGEEIDALIDISNCSKCNNEQKCVDGVCTSEIDTTDPGNNEVVKVGNETNSAVRTRFWKSAKTTDLTHLDNNNSCGIDGNSASACKPKITKSVSDQSIINNIDTD